MKINFGTLEVDNYAKKLINEIIDSGNMTQGRLVKEFEEKFAEIIGTKYAVAVSSGTDALAISFSALYDELKLTRSWDNNIIIVPALTYISSASAILQAGFTPRFIDVDLNTLNIDYTKIKVDESVKAILAIHLMGNPIEIEKMPKGIIIIEDAAQAHGSTYKGKNVGTFGLMACFSTYAAHIISSIEGGVITTDREDLAEIFRSLRNHGRECSCNICTLKEKGVCKKRFNKDGFDIRFKFSRVGYSSKMNEFEAAIGLSHIKKWNEIIDKRRENYYYFVNEFKRFNDCFITYPERENKKIGPHAFPLVLRENVKFSREALMEHLYKNGIDFRTIYQSIPTESGGYEYLGHKYGDFKNAEFVSKNGLHFGVHQDIDYEGRKYIIKVFEEFLKEYK